MGPRTAIAAAEWAIRHLGAVPRAATSAREDWEAKAGKVAGYREQYVASKHIKVDGPPISGGDRVRHGRRSGGAEPAGEESNDRHFVSFLPWATAV